MARLIDTSVFVTMDRQGLPLGILAANALDELLALASITASELLVRVYRTAPGQRRRRREAFVESVFEELPVLPYDLRVARKHADLLVHLLSTGEVIGANDLMIAATALTYGYEVLTHNIRDFQRVPGLVVRQPDW
jgi:tRNA(fMet)-specific endonuclease VapC